MEPGIDGVFRHVEALAHFLVEKGYQVHLAYSDRRASTGLCELVRFVEKSGGRCLNLRVRNAPSLQDPIALLQLRRFANRVGPDVIHAHSSKAGALVRLLSLLGIRARYFYTPHAYYGLGARSMSRVAFFNFIERLLGSIGTTINVSQDEAAFARQKLGVASSRQCVIPNPVDQQRFTPADADRRRRARSTLGFDPEDLVLGAMGRLSFQKDPLTLYHAVAAAFQDNPRLRLCHIGQGELENECAELASSLQIGHRLTRRKYLNEPALFYDALDAVIMTSRYEGLPLLALETMACNLPLILSDASGMHDLTEKGLSHCWQAQVGSPKAFHRAIAAWMADIPENRRCNHRAIAEAHFSIEHVYGELVAVYRAEE